MPGVIRLGLEGLFWTAGLGLLAFYLATIAGLEGDRQEGIERFIRAQAEAGAVFPIPPPEAVRTVGRSAPAGAMADAGPADEPSAEGLPIALLRIDAVGLEVPVFSDIRERNLSRGAGWIPGTAAPDDVGNMAIAAHRDQYFRVLKDVAVGDLLELESLSGRRNYEITVMSIVEPEDLWPLDPADVATVTLVTCYPFHYIGPAPQRFIIQAVATNTHDSK